MTVEELIKAQQIIENSKKTLVCNSNVAKVLQENNVNRNFKIIINEFIEDNQCLLYDNDKLNF